MASIVMSRFILNLRTIHSQDLSLPTLSSGARSIDSLRFAPPSPLDNIGAPLDVEDYNVREFEDEVYEVHNGDGDHVADPSDATDGSGISDKCRVEEREEGDGLAIV
ncbi:hypothetical protein C8Q74DRAFT_349305 [Fomes fomentarius]|nr:hypothetical protein C8Q74DRAFT_349305 [Fomes fomentarius]